MPFPAESPVNLRNALAAAFLACAALPAPAQVADGDSHYDDRFNIPILEGQSALGPLEAKAVAVDSQYAWFGGIFPRASGLVVNHVLRLHKATGRVDRLGGADACGVNGRVNVILPVSGGVYVGGYFTHAGVDSGGNGGIETGPLAFFDGKEWKAAGPPLTYLPGKAEVHSIAVGGGGVFVGGDFTKGGDTTLSNIGLLKGAAWNPLWEQGRLTEGVGGTARRIVATPSAVYVGGGFTTAGGQGVAYVARWNWTTESWDGLKGGMSHAPEYQGIDDMDIDGVGKIWVGAKGLLSYDPKADTGWALLPGTEGALVRNFVLTTPFGTFLQGTGGTLFAGSSMVLWTDKGFAPVDLAGFGLNAGSDFAGDGQRVWIASDGGLEGTLGMHWFDGKTFGFPGNGLRVTRAGGIGIAGFADLGGKTVVGGSFSHLGMTAAEGVARWTGDAWESLGSPYESVYRIAVFKGTLYVAGSLNKRGEAVAGGLARWTGSAWEIVPGFEKLGGISAMAASSKYLWLAHEDFAKGSTRTPVGRWDGTNLEVLGAELKHSRNAGIGIFDILPRGEEGACVAGRFDLVGPDASNGIACTDGKAWAPMGGTAAASGATALAGVGNDLYLGCNCTFPGGHKNLARWDGKAWAAVPGALDALVAGLHANGGDLYAAGYFKKAGDLAVNGIARWDGKAWSALGSGASLAAVGAAWVGPGGLWLAGAFTAAGGVPSRNLARYANVEKKPDLAIAIHPRHARVRARALPLLRYRQGRMEFGSAASPRRADGRGLEAHPVP